MSVMGKLIEKLYRKPGNFTYDEACSLLKKLGCQEVNRTVGSSVTFIYKDAGPVYQMHRPHPGNTLKPYQIKGLIEYYEGLKELEKRDE